MRPYVAVIADSLIEALYSRVLWMLIGCITLLLVVLAPIGVRYPLTTNFERGDLDDPVGLAEQLIQASRTENDSPARAVWGHLSPLQQEAVEQLSSSPDDRAELAQLRSRVVSGLNLLVEEDDLFSEAQWKQIVLSREGRRLKKLAKRTRLQEQRLKRIALQATFPRFLKRGPRTSAQFTYFGWSLGPPLPMIGGSVREAVPLVLLGFMNGVAAPLGVLIAILVTASIVPNMFDAGSVNLLFSKPLLRPLLFLAKFLGGCWFVLISASYLVGGLWLILGWRFELWHGKILWLIPILSFLFAVYYTVSALVGLVWRNTIIAIATTILFWAVCFCVGLSFDLIQTLSIVPQRISKIVVADDDVFTILESGTIDICHAEDRSWRQVYPVAGDQNMGQFEIRNSIVGPVFDPQQNRLVAIASQGNQSQLMVAYHDNHWDWSKKSGVPRGCVGLFRMPTGELIVVERNGVSRIDKVDEQHTADLSIFGWKYTLGPKRGALQSIGPTGESALSRISAAAVDPSTGWLFVVADGKLVGLESTPDHLRFEGMATAELVSKETATPADDAEDFEPSTKSRMVVLAAAAGHIVVADEKGFVSLRDGKTLKTTQTLRPFGDSQPRFAISSDDGNFIGVLFHNGHLWLYDVAAEQDVTARVPFQGSITAAEFGDDGHLLLSDRIARVRQVAIDSPGGPGAVQKTYAGSLGLIERVFFYGVRPLYHLFPKPGKLKDTAGYLLTEQNAVNVSRDRSLKGARVQWNPWAPVWSSLAFMVVMLGLACIYIQRAEF